MRLLPVLVALAVPIATLGRLAAPAHAGGQAEACRTPWEMHAGEGLVPFGYQTSAHGIIEEYAFATIPDPEGPGWGPAPVAQTIDYDLQGNSTLCGQLECRHGGEFTYFKTVVYLPPQTAYSASWVDVEVVDDGVRMTVFSADHPAGATDPNGYAFLGGGVSADLLPYMGGSDWSTIVLTHVDDCCSAAYIRGVEFVVYVDGREVPLPIDCDLIDGDGDGYPPAGGDCDDDDPAVHPFMPESEDGLDQDCDGVIDEGTGAFDDDGDGWAENDGDCDDGNPFASPGGEEQCEQHDLDYDCDGCPGSTDVDCGGTCGEEPGDDDSALEDVGDDDSAGAADPPVFEPEPAEQGCACFSQRLPAGAALLLLPLGLRRRR